MPIMVHLQTPYGWVANCTRNVQFESATNFSAVYIQDAFANSGWPATLDIGWVQTTRFGFNSSDRDGGLL